MTLAAAPAGAVTLEVVVANVRNDKGTVRVAACTQRTFTKETCEHVGAAKAKPGETVVKLELPPGVWAVQAYQDENDNGKIDKNFLGLPTEGIGFSNDAPMRMGPPSFRDAAFQLGPGGGRIRLSLRYF